MVLALAWLSSVASITQAAESSVTGQALDAQGHGIGGVQVKVFLDGFVRASSVTDTTGSFSLDFRSEQSADPTVVVWFLPPAGLIPEVVMLRESQRAKARGLWSPCLPRVALGPSIRVDTTLLTPTQKIEALDRSDCI